MIFNKQFVKEISLYFSTFKTSIIYFSFFPVYYSYDMGLLKTRETSYILTKNIKYNLKKINYEIIVFQVFTKTIKYYWGEKVIF